MTAITKDELGYIKKRHDENTRMLIYLAIGSVSFVVLTSLLVGLYYHWSFGAKLEDLKYQVTELRAEVSNYRKAIRNDMSVLKDDVGTINRGMIQSFDNIQK